MDGYWNANTRKCIVALTLDELAVISRAVSELAASSFSPTVAALNVDLIEHRNAYADLRSKSDGHNVAHLAMEEPEDTCTCKDSCCWDERKKKCICPKCLCDTNV